MSLDDFLAWLMIYCVSGSLLNDWYIWIERDFGTQVMLIVIVLFSWIWPDSPFELFQII